MAKTTFENLVNKVLRRVNETVTTDTSTATGKALIVVDYINDAQEVLFNETSWYSLYTTRDVPTVATEDEIAVASNHGKTILLKDVTNDRVLIEDVTRGFDEQDPGEDTTGPPTHFALQGSNYRLWPIPDAVYTLRDRYWKKPATLSANSDTTDLPIETEILLTQWALAEMQEYLNSFEKADRTRNKFLKLLTSAKKLNRKKIDRMDVFQQVFPNYGFGIAPAKLPSTYPRGW